MNVSFSVVFCKHNEIDELVRISEEYFGIEKLRMNRNVATIVNADYSYIIKISQQSMKFILYHEKETSIDENLNNISRFLDTTFEDEIIGVKFHGEKKFDLHNINKVHLVSLN